MGIDISSKMVEEAKGFPQGKMQMVYLTGDMITLKGMDYEMYQGRKFGGNFGAERNRAPHSNLHV